MSDLTRETRQVIREIMDKHSEKPDFDEIKSLLDAADELERLREGLRRIAKKQRNEAKRNSQMAHNPRRTATSVAICEMVEHTRNEFVLDVESLLNGADQ